MIEVRLRKSGFDSEILLLDSLFDLSLWLASHTSPPPPPPPPPHPNPTSSYSLADHGCQPRRHSDTCPTVPSFLRTGL
jgi:hypothetical protein